jgi:hypothetical protein
MFNAANRVVVRWRT